MNRLLQSLRWRPAHWLVVLAVLPTVLARPDLSQAAPVECWRGWGYRLDSRSGTYLSGELLLVTLGAPRWAPGNPVVLYQLDHATINWTTPPAGSGAIRRR